LTDFSDVTFGAEYEFGDIYRTELPYGLTWNEKDYSIVSSTGIANDPKGLVYTRGGEINSVPTKYPEQQLAMFADLIEQHPEASVNHRTNLHLHIRVAGLSEDLDVLKRLLAYIDANQVAIYQAIEPVPVPVRADYASAEAYKGAQKRYKRRKVSHQYAVSATRVERALGASTVEQFLAAHAPVQADGKPAWGLTTRAGINLLQLKETDTIEFRHFTCTKNVRELLHCFNWVSNFVPAALDNAPVEQLLSAADWQFPTFAPYDHAMECGYQYSNFDKNSRKVATQRINALRDTLDIDNCTAEQTVEAIKQIEGKLALESV
jgi:hypothetical protein